MFRRRIVAAFTFALLLPAFSVLPSCSDASCADGGEGCPCKDPKQCGKLDICKGWYCDGTCHLTDAPLRWPCPGGVCDGAGQCLGCVEDADCGPGHTCEAGNVCTRCDDGILNGNETSVDCGGACPLCPGTCNVNADCPGGYCWEGLCVRCDDGIQNGDEVAVDCGTLFGHCPVCTGYNCIDDAQCVSGICSADGTCCKVPCDGCNACDVAGDCYPSFGSVPWAGCSEGQACGFGGGCGWLPGHACTKDEECAQLKCVNGVCE
ncbi:hypothetical protein [Polyangium aurulentum]|uniref:hypothetical protein n=1 Tax=Polyangium aurulentum TaxID=2567896 RepID=UPI0010AE9645|nr:hypothetical protein [Polyangium aurulentum]UQA61359.1 hypothetical protein E8A73_013145 [Polyangium aurulentum]